MPWTSPLAAAGATPESSAAPPTSPEARNPPAIGPVWGKQGALSGHDKLVKPVGEFGLREREVCVEHRPTVLHLDLSGKRALVAGVADDVGFGWAIAKALREAGATVCLACWPPAMGIFEKMLSRGKFDDSRLMADGSLLDFEKIYPLDAIYDTLEDVPEEVKSSRRYESRSDFSMQGLANSIASDFGAGKLDVVVHSLANGPEVHLPLLETSRKGYLAAVSASAYSLVSMVKQLAPLMSDGGSVLSLTYLAAERTIPGYGGGMAAAKAALESDTRTLAFEAGRKHNIRVNTISAGPVATRAASVTGVIEEYVKYYQQNSPRPRVLATHEVANTAVFLSSPLASAVTGSTVYVDNGYHTMGKAYPVQSEQ